MDYLLSSSTGQSPSAAVSSTETQDQIFAPSFLPSDRVQESLFSPLNFSQGFDRHTIDTHAVQPSAVFPLTVPIYPQTFEQIPPTSRRLRGPARHSIRPKNFQCSDCGRSYDRSSRAQTCENNHLGVKKYRCFGRCGELLWYVSSPFRFIISYRPIDSPKTYASPSGLDRHCLPYPERAVSCDDW